SRRRVSVAFVPPEDLGATFITWEATMKTGANSFRTTVLAAAVAMAFAQASMASVPVITTVTFDAGTNQLTLVGTNLQDPQPTKFPLEVFFGNSNTALAVLPGATTTKAVVQLPYAPAPGGYLIQAYTKIGDGVEEFWITVGAVGPTGATGATGATGPIGAT